MAEVLQPPRAIANLLLHFPLSRLCRALPLVHPSCRGFEQVAGDWVSVLANEYGVPGVIDGQDDHCMGMLYDLAGSQIAVRKCDPVDAHADDYAVEYLAAVDSSFRLYALARVVTAHGR